MQDRITRAARVRYAPLLGGPAAVARYEGAATAVESNRAKPATQKGHQRGAPHPRGICSVGRPSCGVSSDACIRHEWKQPIQRTPKDRVRCRKLRANSARTQILALRAPPIWHLSRRITWSILRCRQSRVRHVKSAVSGTVISDTICQRLASHMRYQ